MNIAETKVPIKIEGRDFTLVFDVNTMCAYEEKTGQFFLETCASIMDVIFPDGMPSEKNPMIKAKINPSLILKKVSMVQLRALLWAAMHEYDPNDEPIWPLTLHQVGKLITLTNMVSIFKSFLAGNAANSPTVHEMGESQRDVQEMPQNAPPTSRENTGERSIELPATAFASETEKSAA